MTDTTSDARAALFDYPFHVHDRLEINRVPAGGEDTLVRVHLPYGGDAWLAHRHEHVREVLTHPAFSRAAIVGADVPRPTERVNVNVSLPAMDAPEHTRQRRMVSRAFSAVKVEAMRGRVEEIMESLLDDAIAAGGPIDLVADIAWPLPVRVISDLLGVPIEDREKFRYWTDASISISAHSSEEAMQAMIDLLGYFHQLAALRRADPRDDLMTSLVRISDEEDGLTADEVAMFGVVLLIGGYETTANMFGNLVYVLLTHPDQLAKVRADPALLPQTIEEVLRYVPLNAAASLPSIATEDVEIGGVLVKKGDAVFVEHGIANRDPEVFDDPDRFDVARGDNPHLTFGYGPHRCIGAQLTRLELSIALEAVLRRLPDFDFAEPPAELPWKQGRQFRSIERLPITWSQD